MLYVNMDGQNMALGKNHKAYRMPLYQLAREGDDIWSAEWARVLVHLAVAPDLLRNVFGKIFSNEIPHLCP